LRVKDNKIVLTEAQITRQCIDYLKVEGWECVRQHVGMFQTRTGRTVTIGKAGDPDWIAFRFDAAGYSLFYIEFKSPTGRLRKAQRIRIEQLRDVGHEVCVCRGLDDLKAWMRETL